MILASKNSKESLKHFAFDSLLPAGDFPAVYKSIMLEILCYTVGLSPAAYHEIASI